MDENRRALVELSVAGLDGAILALEDLANRYGWDRALTLGDFIIMLRTIAQQVREGDDG